MTGNVHGVEVQSVDRINIVLFVDHLSMAFERVLFLLDVG